MFVVGCIISNEHFFRIHMVVSEFKFYNGCNCFVVFVGYCSKFTVANWHQN